MYKRVGRPPTADTLDQKGKVIHREVGQVGSTTIMVEVLESSNGDKTMNIQVGDGELSIRFDQAEAFAEELKDLHRALTEINPN